MNTEYKAYSYVVFSTSLLPRPVGPQCLPQHPILEHPQPVSDYYACEIGLVEAVRGLRASMNFYSYFTIAVWFWVKFSTRDKDIMLLTISELREHWFREGHTFRTGVKEIIFTRVRETFWYSESKERLCEFVVCVTECIIYSLPFSTLLILLP